jgi:L,D-transpeptidase catalytic domain
LASFTGLPINATTVPAVPAHNNYSLTTTENTSVTVLYSTLDLESIGLSKQAFEYAYKGYQYLLDKKLVSNSYLTICDFSQSSKQKRLYVIDLTNNKVVMNTYVAHGRNSGLDYATKFSNKPESLQSSLGFYVTRQTYSGEHGLSLKIQGLEPGFNDKAYERAIVVHGADYIGAERLHSSPFMGRSYGCPAIPAKESATLINTIKNGTCLFIYHPAKNYLLGSKILNG